MMITFSCEFDPEAGKMFWIDLTEQLAIEEIMELENQALQRLVCKLTKNLRFSLKDQTSNPVYFCVPHINIDKYTSNEGIMLLCRVI